MLAFITYALELNRENSLRAVHFSLDRIADDQLTWFKLEPTHVDPDVVEALNDLRTDWADFHLLRIGLPVDTLLGPDQLSAHGFPVPTEQDELARAHIGRIDLSAIRVQLEGGGRWIDITDEFRGALPPRRPSVVATESAALLLERARLETKLASLRSRLGEVRAKRGR